MIALRQPALFGGLVFALLELAALPSARAQTAAAPDALTTTPPESSRARAADESAGRPRYYFSTFAWEHSVTAATVGIGRDPQSLDANYQMGFAARPRYYFYDRRGDSLSARAEGGLYREFTNSDTTTRRGEWDFADTNLALVMIRRLSGTAELAGTSFELRLPVLELPTSKASYSSGRYFSLGTRVSIGGATPILEHVTTTPMVASLRLSADYGHWFADARVPTQGSLARVRMGPDGRSVPADQLAGTPFIAHQLSFGVRARLLIGENVLLTTDASFNPAWKYRLDEQVELCGVVLTGCTTVDSGSSAPHYLVTTQFASELSVRVTRAFSIDFGYSNVASQLGADGTRRSPFYSRDARFTLALTFVPHELRSEPVRASARATPPLGTF